MPELPEVETVCRGLRPALLGKQIARADVNRADLRWPFPDNFASRLCGARVRDIRRRAKYILAELDTHETLIIHLGMSGRVLISGTSPTTMYREHRAAGAHDHVVLHIEGDVRVTYNDPRRFGVMDLVQTRKLNEHRLLKDAGPEPLGNAFNEQYLEAAINGRRSPVKSALLDQQVVAGLGNIYVCESLFRARISPKRLCQNLGSRRISRLIPNIRDVLQEAIEAGGSSLQDFRQVDGELGYFQHNFEVYDREGHPCRRNDCGGTVRRIVQSGRSTFYCATCQR